MLNVRIHHTWDGLLTPEFKAKVAEAEDAVGKEMEDYYPRKKNVFRFLGTDLSSAKCVILGMEPYPSSYYNADGRLCPVATGRSFEVGNVTDWQQKFQQSSLRNILKTIYYHETGADISLESLRKLIDNDDYLIMQPQILFINLELQGVIFLNAALTVKPGCPGSHTAIWKNVMDDVLSYINTNASVKWLLFGNHAKERVETSIGLGSNMYMFVHPRLASFVHQDPFSVVPEISWSGYRKGE